MGIQFMFDLNMSCLCLNGLVIFESGENEIYKMHKHNTHLYKENHYL